MYFKLVLRNLQRSLKDYMLYFLTMTLAISLIFSFNSIGVSKDILNLADNMSTFKPTMKFVTIIIVWVIAYLVSYITKFIVKRRKKEFGLYLLLGMKNRTVAKIFIYENIVFGLLSFILGLILGSLLFQSFTYIIMNIFNNFYSFKITVSFKAILLTLIYCSIIYAIIILMSSKLVSTMKIYDLLYDSKKNEKIIYRKGGFLKLIFSFVLCFVGIGLVFHVFNVSNNSAYSYAIIGLICIGAGVYTTYTSIPFFMEFFATRFKSFKYKNTNTFLIRQLVSKLHTNVRTMGVISILISIALSLLITGLAFGRAYKVNIEGEAPFDISVSIDYPYIDFSKVYSFVNEKSTIEQSVNYKLYRNTQDKNEVFGNDYMKLSVYNKLRNQLGLDPVLLPNDMFIVHCEDWSLQDDIAKNLEGGMTISIDNKSLTSNKSYLFTEAFAQYGVNGNNYLYVVNDYLFEALEVTKSRFIASTIDPAPQSLRNDLNSFIKDKYHLLLIENFKPAKNQSITKKVVVKSWSHANGLVSLSLLSFASLYISLIFIMIGMTILALQQLTDSAEHKYRFRILRNIGVSNNEINKVIFKQIFIYFAVPIILPILIVFVVFHKLNSKLGHIILEKGLIMNVTLSTFIIFFIVYMVYFITTYIGFKRNIYD